MWCLIAIIVLVLCLIVLLMNSRSGETYDNVGYGGNIGYGGESGYPFPDWPMYYSARPYMEDDALMRHQLKRQRRLMGYPYNYKRYPHPAVFQRYTSDSQYDYPL